MSNFVLYEIDEEILGCVDEETGEVFDIEKFESLSMERDFKLESLCLWVKDLKAKAEALKAEKQALEQRQKSAEKRMESVKRYISDYLAGAKFETTKVKVSFRKSESLEIAEGAVIPEEFLRYKEPEVNKTELKAAVKAGVAFEGVSLVQKNNIQIK